MPPQSPDAENRALQETKRSMSRVLLYKDPAQGQCGYNEELTRARRRRSSSAAFTVATYSSRSCPSWIELSPELDTHSLGLLPISRQAEEK